MPTFTYFVPTSLTLDPRRDPTIGVSTQLNPGGNSSSFKVNERPQFSQFSIVDPVSDRTLFKGSVSKYTDEYEDNPDNEVHGITGLDGSWFFNKYRPFGRFTSTSLSQVVVSLVGTYAPDFTTVHVQTGLPAITIVFTGEETLDQAITRAVQLAGNCRWYKDYDNDIHVFHVDPPSLPGPGPLRPGPASALSAVQAAGLVVGPSGPGSGSFTPGIYLVSYSWEYDDHEVSDYSPWKVVGFDGAHQQTITSIATGSPYLGHNVVARRVWIAYLSNNYGVGGDSRDFVPFAYFRVPDNVTTSVTGNLGGVPQDIGGFYSSFGAYSFIPTYGHSIAQPSNAPAGPLSAPTVSTGGTIASFSYTPGKYVFGYSWLYADGIESLMSPVSGVYNADGVHVPNFVLATGSPRPGDAVPVIARKIYWAYDAVNTPVFDAPHGYGDGHAAVADNTTTSYGWDLVPIGSVNGAYASFHGDPVNIETQPGPDPEDDGNTPEDVTDDSPLLMKEPPLTVTYDKSQIRNRVFVRGKSVAAVAAAIVGAQTIIIPVGHPFSGTGGQVFVGTQVYRYDSVGSTSIHLTTGLTTAVVVGDIVGLWTQQDDLDAQNWLAEQEDGDGVHEYTIVDTSLETVADIERRGQAELALFARPLVTVDYSTRDVKSFPGRRVTINVNKPPISGVFLIQKTEVDQIDETQDDSLLPRFKVSASSTIFTLDDLLRNVSLVSSGGAGVASTGSSSGGTGGGSGGGTVSTNVFGETPTGSINGINTVFTTAHAYFRNRLRVFVNGLRQRPANVTETSATTFTLGTAPRTGDSVLVDYEY